MSKICPNCKAENRDQANFCQRCNTRLGSETPLRYCPAGKHPMDPGWDTCPYCAASGPAAGPPPLPGRGRTLVENEPSAASTAPFTSPAVTAPPPVDSAPAAGAGSRRKTVFDPGPSAQEPRGGEAGERRRMVAVLVTYTWKPEGQLFPVREGRNWVGRDAECEISLPNDTQMSSRHATIVYRGQDFWIDDEKTMNGTLVDGENVEEKRRLPEGATIRTGATVWRFVQLPKLAS